MLIILFDFKFSSPFIFKFQHIHKSAHQPRLLPTATKCMIEGYHGIQLLQTIIDTA